MEFRNETPLPAAMVPSAEADDRVTTLFLCAITYRYAGKKLAVAPAQRPLLLAPEAKYPNDAVFTKEVVGVCATGFVYPREGKVAREAMASLRVGTAEASIRAFGPRVWQRGALGKLVPSAPLPFERVAMTWENAYGGMTAEPAAVMMVDGEEAFVPEHEAGYPLNFEGKGFATDEARALDQPLPQLEDPAEVMRRWDDRPEPVCFAPYPLQGGMRARYVVRDKQVDLAGVSKLGSRAAPRTTFERVEVGTEIMLSGMRPQGEVLAFAVPPSPVEVALSVGGASERLIPWLDAIDIEAEAGEVRLVYRAKVTYGLVQFEVRRATLTPMAHFPEG